MSFVDLAAVGLAAIVVDFASFVKFVAVAVVEVEALANELLVHL